MISTLSHQTNGPRGGAFGNSGTREDHHQPKEASDLKSSSMFRSRLKRQCPFESTNTSSQYLYKSWCSEPQCQRRALYVLNHSAKWCAANVTVTPMYFCAEHRRAGSVADLSPSQRCRFVGGPSGDERCLRWPSYGDAKRRVPIFCREHAPTDYVNVKARMCKAASGCQVQASFGDPIDGRVRSCPFNEMSHPLIETNL
jgi:hypothetical protein